MIIIHIREILSRSAVNPHMKFKNILAAGKVNVSASLPEYPMKGGGISAPITGEGRRASVQAADADISSSTNPAQNNAILLLSLLKLNKIMRVFLDFV